MENDQGTDSPIRMPTMPDKVYAIMRESSSERSEEVVKIAASEEAASRLKNELSERGYGYYHLKAFELDCDECALPACQATEEKSMADLLRRAADRIERLEAELARLNSYAGGSVPVGTIRAHINSASDTLSKIRSSDLARANWTGRITALERLLATVEGEGAP